MKKLDIIAIKFVAEGTAIWAHRYNNDNTDQSDFFTYIQPGQLTNDEVLSYAKTLVDPNDNIQVSIAI